MEEDKAAWPVWDGTGATPAVAPSTTLPTPEDVAKILDFKVSAERKQHAIEQIRRQADDSGWMEFLWKGHSSDRRKRRQS